MGQNLTPKVGRTELMTQRQEQLFTQSDHFLLQMIEEIKKARKSVDVEYYMISADPIGSKFFEALAYAREKGIRVRLLIDGWGSHESLPILIYWAQQMKLELTIYHPPLWLHEALPSLRHLFKINQRTHRKLVIIDGTVAFTGSINLSREHFESQSGKHAWLDLGLRLQGKTVYQIQNVFNASWEQESDEGTSKFTLSRLPKVTSTVRANQTKRHRYKLYLDLIKRIHEAEERITIVNPYFIPTDKIVRALKKSAMRGVKIEILLPFKSDLKLFPWFNFFGVRSLIRYGVRFYEYLPSILHSKLTIIDDFYMLGSSNWNTRSFYHDRELDIEIQSKTVKTQLDDFLSKTINSSRRIDHRTLRERFTRDYPVRPFFYFLKYWI